MSFFGWAECILSILRVCHCFSFLFPHLSINLNCIIYGDGRFCLL